MSTCGRGRTRTTGTHNGNSMDILCDADLCFFVASFYSWGGFVGTNDYTD